MKKREEGRVSKPEAVEKNTKPVDRGKEPVG